MTPTDPVLDRLASLPVPALTPGLAARVHDRAVARLRVRPIHPLWTAAVVASVLSYLGWALHFSASLY